MKYFIAIIFSFMPFLAFAQQTYEIVDFPGPYYGKVFLSDTTQNFGGEGWVALFDKKTGKELAKSKASYFNIDSQDLTGKNTIAYKDQSYIICKDFSFDGIKDLALYNGLQGVHGQATYDIWLGTKIGFQFSQAFTDIIMKAGSFFKIHKDNQTLVTFASAGNSNFVQSVYKVVNNQPVPLYNLFGTIKHDFIRFKGQVWQNGEKAEKEFYLFGDNRSLPGLILTYQIPPKTYLQLYAKDDSLHCYLYAFVGKGKYNLVHAGAVLSYSSRFMYQPKKEILKFKMGDSAYKIKDHELIISSPYSFYFNSLDPKKHVGSLKRLQKWFGELKNVEIATPKK